MGGALNQTVGKISFNGSFEQLDVTLFTDYKIPVDIFEGHTQFSMYLPIREVRVKNVQMTMPKLPATPTGNTVNFFNDWLASSDTFKDRLTNTAHVTDLDLNSWSRTGAGDIAAIFKWSRIFKQDKEFIRSVQLYFKGGVSIPTGKEQDVDKVFSVPLGRDGAFGIPFGIGLALNMKYRIQIGIDTEFIPLLDHTTDYRMKTSLNQSEFLLLEKGRATKDHGLTWVFNAYAKGVQLWQGLSIKGGYEYQKHDADNLTPKTNDFDYNIVNSANSLKEWNMHNLIFQLNWDSYRVNKKMIAKPQLGVFFKVPINGVNIIAPYTVGGQLAFNF